MHGRLERGDKLAHDKLGLACGMRELVYDILELGHGKALLDEQHLRI